MGMRLQPLPGEKIKIIHLVDKFGIRGASTHGVSRLFSWWMPRFDQRRFEVRLIGLRRAEAGFQQLTEQGIRVSTLNKSRFDFSTVGAIKEAVETFGADILHLHGYGAANFGRIAARLTGTRAVVHEHFVDPAMPIYQIPFDYALARYTDAAIAVSSSVRDFMVQKRFVPAQRIEVIFNGAPLEEFKPGSPEQCRKERARWEVAPECTLVATIGRLDEQKGIHFFLKAAALLARDNPQTRFMVVGDGPLQEELQNQADGLGLAGKVIFTGYCTDIPRLQSIIDIQVFPSLWEGAPLTLFEAMAMRKSIVATDVDGMGEILDHEQNAMVVQSRDASGLASSILQLLDNPVKAEALAARAQADSRKYHIQATVDKIQEVYDGLLGRPGKPLAVEKIRCAMGSGF